jgi:hypothetical protein
METWGCEFLDNDTDREPPPASDFGNVFQVPMSLMSYLVDKKYQKEIRIRDKEQLQGLTVDIARRGILKPATIHYSDKYIRLYDGNHRYHCAKTLGLESFPVVFVHVPKMQNQTGSSLLYAFNFLLEELRRP